MKNWKESLLNRKQIDPSKYLLSKDLENVVRVALTLNQPILLTGEPGTGKTLLAYKIAHELNKLDGTFRDKPLVFNTKTTSAASDLFYSYDAIRHFYDANISKTSGKVLEDISHYIEIQALGKAITISNEKEVTSRRFVQESSARNSVVLIDEIDKAPRDFPNDILHEIDKFEFEIKEANSYKIKKGDQKKIVVIMTSNSEKNLPDAFLRRCIFYYIPFPDKEQLSKIIEANFPAGTKYSDGALIDFFLHVRNSLSKKKPATAELLSWLKILEVEDFIKDGDLDFNNLSDQQKRILKLSYPVLAKTTEDIQKLDKISPV